MSWHAQQIAPHFSAEVSLLLSQVNSSCVATIVKTNQLVERAKAKKDHVMRIHHFPEGTELGVFAGELLHGPPDPRNPDETVAKVTGVVISDSRNVYDKLSTAVLTIRGAEKKSNIELLAIKEAQERTRLLVRWVHSEAQLSNSLTKEGGSHELELFYKMGQRWRIVEDPQMRSSRRRKKEGVAPLQQSNLDGNEEFEEFSVPGVGVMQA